MVQRSVATVREKAYASSCPAEFSSYPLQTPHVQPLRLVSYDEAPQYLKRPHILSGYLIGGTPAAAALTTLFQLNNESINAWTMVAGLAAGLAGFAIAWTRLPGQLGPALIMLLAGLPHSPVSIRLHLTIGVSEDVRDFWRTVDVLFIFACAVPRAAALGWYVFDTSPSYSTYLAFISVAYLYCIFSTMVRRHIKDIPKPVLAKDVTVTVLCYTLPVLVQALHELCTSGPGLGTWCYGSIFCLLVAGSSAYSQRWPERWAPGRFDLVGSSHQVMHTAVVLEYCVEWAFLLCMAHRHEQQFSSSPMPLDQLSQLLVYLASPQSRY